ncbi:MAG TPA: hypothetical protein ENF75_06000 [Acidilobales archaeon]|nr:hypothetical protein [Acidilobales archaeon]
MSSFEEALGIAKAVNDKLTTVRKEALQKLPVVRVAAFNVLSNVVGKTVKIVELVRELERRVEVGSKGVKRFCGNWIITKDENSVSILKLKPLRSVSYDRTSRRLSLSNDVTRLELGENSLKLVLRGREEIIEGISLDSINSKVDVIKSLGRYLIELIDTIYDAVNLCWKSLRGI